MKTTSFQGTAPAFAGNLPQKQNKSNRTQNSAQNIAADTIRFSGDLKKTDNAKDKTKTKDAKKTEEAKKTNDSQKSESPGFFKKSGKGLKRGFLAMFRFRHGGLLQDFTIGTVAAAALLIIPPHLHALGAYPFAFTFGMLWRFAVGAKKGFKGEP